MKKSLFLSVMALVVIACNQNAPEQPGTEPETKESKVNAYFANPVAWNGTFVEVNNAIQKTVGARQQAPMRRTSEDPTYPIYSFDPQDGTWPVTVTVNYGETAILGVDGLEHSGTIRISATNFFEKPGSVVTPVLDNFHVYGTVLTGSQTIQNLGFNNDSNLVFQVDVANGVLGSKRDFIYSERTMRELVSGLGDNGFLVPDLSKHQYSITGWMKGESNIDSIPGFDIAIDSVAPMVIAVGDLYPTSGHLHVDLAKPLVSEFDENELPKNFPVSEISIDECELYFLGKVSAGVYSAKLQVPVNMVTAEIVATISFNLNKDGVIAESVKFAVEQ